MALLNERQIRFAENLILGMSQKDAYLAAGYDADEKTAAASGSKLACDERIVSYLHERRAELQERTNVTVEKNIQELARIGYADIREVLAWDEQGVRFIPSAFLNRDQAGAISSIKSKRRTRTDEDGITHETVDLEVKMHDKLGALEKLNKILGVYQADRMNDADREGHLLATVFGRYIMALHLNEGITVAEAMNRAKANPEEVEAWGRKVKLLPAESTSS